MAGLINSNILTNPKRRIGQGSADQAMANLSQPGGTQLAPYSALPPATTPRFGSASVQPVAPSVPFAGEVAGTSQALTAAPGGVAGQSGGGMNAAPIDLGAYYQRGGVPGEPVDLGSYYQKGGEAGEPVDLGSYYQRGGEANDPVELGDYYQPGGEPAPPIDLGAYYQPGGEPAPRDPIDLGAYYQPGGEPGEPINLGDYYQPGGEDRAAGRGPVPGAPAPTVPRSKAQQYGDKYAGDDVVEKRLGRPLTDDEKEEAYRLRQRFESDYLAAHPEDRDEHVRLQMEQKAVEDNGIRIRPPPVEDPDLGYAYAPEPQPEPGPEPEPGELDKPGVLEDAVDEHGDDILKADEREQKWVDQLMKRGGLGPRNFDEFYNNAWQHSSADINSEYAGRGMGDSSDALRALSHSRTDLAAQQSRDEADYAMKSWQNDIDRLIQGATLQGGIGDRGIKRFLSYIDAKDKSQYAEERRVRGGIEDTWMVSSGMFDDVMREMGDLSDDDRALVMQILSSLPAEFMDQQNMTDAQKEKATAAIGNLAKLIGGGETPTAAATK